jgi:hypothetical protein
VRLDKTSTKMHLPLPLLHRHHLAFLVDRLLLVTLCPCRRRLRLFLLVEGLCHLRRHLCQVVGLQRHLPRLLHLRLLWAVVWVHLQLHRRPHLHQVAEHRLLRLCQPLGVTVGQPYWRVFRAKVFTSSKR